MVNIVNGIVNQWFANSSLDNSLRVNTTEIFSSVGDMFTPLTNWEWSFLENVVVGVIQAGFLLFCAFVGYGINNITIPGEDPDPVDPSPSVAMNEKQHILEVLHFEEPFFPKNLQGIIQSYRNALKNPDEEGNSDIIESMDARNSLYTALTVIAPQIMDWSDKDRAAFWNAFDRYFSSEAYQLAPIETLLASNKEKVSVVIAGVNALSREKLEPIEITSIPIEEKIRALQTMQTQKEVLPRSWLPILEKCRVAVLNPSIDQHSELIKKMDAPNSLYTTISILLPKVIHWPEEKKTAFWNAVDAACRSGGPDTIYPLTQEIFKLVHRYGESNIDMILRLIPTIVTKKR